MYYNRTRWSKTTGQNLESGNVNAVLDGDIDKFIEASYVAGQGIRDASMYKGSVLDS